jgi:hypothetical protein
MRTNLVIPALALSLMALLGFSPAEGGEGGQAPAPTPEATGSFLAGLDDLPLTPGLREIKDAGVVFDKPEGRIVEAYAEGRLSVAKVRSFYAATLPQLGWRAEGPGRYRREGEVLSIGIRAAGKGLTVRFFLSPD